MKSNKKWMTVISLLLLLLSGCVEDDASTDNTSIEALYTMPAEDEPHEGTWLQWPHHYEYDDGVTFRDRMDPAWVAMTKALVTSEKVHIIAYDSIEKDRISQLLTNANVSLSNVDLFIFPTNDVWAIGVNYPSINNDRLMSIMVAVPPTIEEQKVIIEFIEIGLVNFEKTISKAQTEIEKAKEYQESLITQVVTGQLKVPCDRDVTKRENQHAKTL
jgi:hypothetical protein